MIKYIGSKRALLPQLVETILGLPDVHSVLDLFSGTARVGHGLKARGLRVTANDHNTYAYALARCYVEADRNEVLDEVEAVLTELRRVPPRAGHFTETYCVQSRYFQPRNGARIEAIRERIRTLDLPPVVEAVALVSLMEAADRVDSTCGLQMAYLKKWAPRSYNDLELRVPAMVAGGGRACHADCVDLLEGTAPHGARDDRERWDAIYLDPPYNQHKYLNNYHVWETLIRGDAPEVYGKAKKRLDCREYHSAFNSKRGIVEAMRRVLLAGSRRARFLVVSFSDEGNLPQDVLRQMTAEVGVVKEASFDYKRYVGAQIGIHNPKGERVGTVSHLRNREHVFVVDCR